MGGLWGAGRVRSQRWDSSGRKPSVEGGTFLLRTLCVLSLPLADVTPGETKLVFLLCCHVFLPSGHRFMEWKDVRILLVRVFFFFLQLTQESSSWNLLDSLLLTRAEPSQKSGDSYPSINRECVGWEESMGKAFPGEWIAARTWRWFPTLNFPRKQCCTFLHLSVKFSKTFHFFLLFLSLKNSNFIFYFSETLSLFSHGLAWNSPDSSGCPWTLRTLLTFVFWVLGLKEFSSMPGSLSFLTMPSIYFSTLKCEGPSCCWESSLEMDLCCGIRRFTL